MADMSSSSNFRAFTVVSVFKETITTLFAHPALFFGLALAAWLPGTVLFLLFPIWVMPLVKLLITLVNFIMSMLVQGAASYAALRVLQGRPMRIRPSLAGGMSRLAPLLGLALIVGAINLPLTLLTTYMQYSMAASLFGGLLSSHYSVNPYMTSCGGMGVMLFLGAGSLFMMCVLNAAVPACVIERRSPIESMKRSAALTRGYRMQIFGLLVLSAFVSYCFTQLFSLPLNLFFFWLPFFKSLATQILAIVPKAFFCLLPPITYYRLRQLKENATLKQMTDASD